MATRPILLIRTDRSVPAGHLADHLARLDHTTVSIVVRSTADLPAPAVVQAAAGVALLDSVDPAAHTAATAAVASWLQSDVMPRHVPVLAHGQGAALAALAGGGMSVPCPPTRGWFTPRAGAAAPAALRSAAAQARVLVWRQQHTRPPPDAEILLTLPTPGTAAGEPLAWRTRTLLALEFLPAPAEREYQCWLEHWRRVPAPPSARCQTVAELVHTGVNNERAGRSLAAALYGDWPQVTPPT